MPKKKYIVALTPDEQERLEQLVRKGKTAAYKMIHAHILLKANINQVDGGWKDQDISDAFLVSVSTVERVRQRLVEHGLDLALSRQTPTRTKPCKLDGKQEAHLIALACSSPPVGQGRWTMRLLADHMVELGYVESVSHETVRQTLKKTNFSPGNSNAG
jgi:transposase